MASERRLTFNKYWAAYWTYYNASRPEVKFCQVTCPQYFMYNMRLDIGKGKASRPRDGFIPNPKLKLLDQVCALNLVSTRSTASLTSLGMNGTRWNASWHLRSQVQGAGREAPGGSVRRPMQGRPCVETNLVRDSGNGCRSDEPGPEQQARAERLSSCPASNTDHKNL